MSFIRSERKCLEILRILKESTEPMGAKRLSELMAEHGFVLSDRAVQYYLSYLDDMGFTRKIGNRGRILTQKGRSETEHALVDERIGFIISKLERLAYRSTLDPLTGTGDVAYNLSIVPHSIVENVAETFDQVLKAGIGFYSSYKIIDRDPRIPPGHTGFITICSITMDGILQKAGIPVRMAYGGRIEVKNNKATRFADLIGYRGTTVDPLQLFISAGLTSIGGVVTEGNGIALANVRWVSPSARKKVDEWAAHMRDAGFILPVQMGTNVFNLNPNPYRLSIVSYSGMNFIGNSIEQGYPLKTEIGAGTIAYYKMTENSH
jgi:repressor of nif and glnA expression